MSSRLDLVKMQQAQISTSHKYIHSSYLTVSYWFDLDVGGGQDHCKRRHRTPRQRTYKGIIKQNRMPNQKIQSFAWILGPTSAPNFEKGPTSAFCQKFGPTWAQCYYYYYFLMLSLTIFMFIIIIIICQVITSASQSINLIQSHTHVIQC